MRLVVGLGNPGPRYENTRHNVGFRVVEQFAARCSIALDEACYDGRLGRGWLPGRDEEVAVFEPLTFMNRSGDPVARALAGLRIEDPARDLLVAHDEVDLPFGRLRLRPAGGPGGHNGVSDIIAALDSRQFARLRFGVGRPDGILDTADWVLAPFSSQQAAELSGLLATGAEAIAVALLEGVETAMNRFNGVEPDADG
ncbi:MAG: aminoacyl-tRNA hydrolase [Deltaproteobacteria bacterium]|nr:aminoacyl-tRNA hydrolase [Deltaproteobacteria bacterium]MBW2360193.1 aminoacyl-tRNA hydrolase [Deltaproteobacteria bacterium]